MLKLISPYLNIISDEIKERIEFKRQSFSIQPHYIFSTDFGLNQLI